MSDQPTDSGNGASAPGGDPQQQQPKMQVLGQFIRDLSFENVLASPFPQRKTLVYGSGVFEYPGLGPKAWVTIREEELDLPSRASF